MSIPSIESRRLRNVGSEESDEYVFLGDLIRFVENSDQSIPRIAELMGISSVVLSMWIAGTAKPTTTKLLEIKRFFERYASEHVDKFRDAQELGPHAYPFAVPILNVRN